MSVSHLLPVVLVAEAPNTDLGVRLAHLDPANAVDFAGKGSEPARIRQCIERTLDLFECSDVLTEDPGPGMWSRDASAESWDALSPRLAGRRVALVGRAAEAALLNNVPPLRWLRLGGEGEPAEVCVLPRLGGRWWRNASNQAAVSEWLRQVRQDREDADEAWTAIGGGWAYHLARGEWGLISDECGTSGPTFLAWSPDSDDKAKVRDRLLEASQGVKRFGGFGRLTILDHCCLVADLCTSPGAKRLGLAHDLHETPLVGDASSPLKRIMRHEWRPVERMAQSAVESLLGLHPTSEEREEVKRADRLALLVEARQVSVDLGDPDVEFGAEAAGRARALACPRSRADWLAAWDACAR